MSLMPCGQRATGSSGRPPLSRSASQLLNGRATGPTCTAARPIAGRQPLLTCHNAIGGADRPGSSGWPASHDMADASRRVVVCQAKDVTQLVGQRVGENAIDAVSLLVPDIDVGARDPISRCLKGECGPS